MIQRFFLLVASVFLLSCHKNEPGFTGASDYEQAVHEILAVPRKNLSPEVIQKVSNHEIYYSLTVSPERLERELPFVLKTLIADTGIPGVPKKIFVTIPEHYRNEEGGKYDPRLISEIQKLDSRIEILRPQFDYGPASKLLGAAEHLQARNGYPHKKQIIVTFDDDTVYSPGLPIQLIEQAVLHNNQAAIGGRGQDATFWGIQNFPGRQLHGIPCHSQEVSNCDVLEGFHAVAYPVHLINTNLIKQIAAPPKQPCRLSDDLVISFVLARLNVPRILVENDLTKVSFTQLEGGFKSGIHLQDNSGAHVGGHQHGQKYRQCYNDILKKKYL